MVHHGGGLINELENDLERLVLSVENRQGGLGGIGGQQSVGYVLPPGVVSYGPNVVSYQQQVYTVPPQPQMVGMQQQMTPIFGAMPAPMRGPLAMPQYDQSCYQTGGQQIIYGGPNGGFGGMQAGGQVYAASYQAYPQAQQPASRPPYLATPQSAPNQVYGQSDYQQSPYQAVPPQTTQQPQAGYAYAGSPAAYVTPQSSPPPSQPAAQAAYNQGQPGSPSPSYPASSQPNPPSVYAQPLPPVVPGTRQIWGQPGTPFGSMPRPDLLLNPQDFQVQFESTAAKADTHHHALKSLEKSAHSIEGFTAILGTYLALKQAHQGNKLLSSTGTYRHSRPDVQAYSHTMDKLESLSSDFVAKHKIPPQGWVDAMGAHRRHIFGTLYNSNELVRGFCSEVPGGPLSMPELDAYALGKALTNFNVAKAMRRAPNLNASFSVLSQVRTVILVDDSGSMTQPGHESWGWSRNRETRWSQARDLMSGLAPLVAQHSPHGIDLHFLNRIPFYGGLRTSAEVDAAFNADCPNNGTPTGQRVNDILDAYMCGLRHYRKMLPLNLIVITDGEAQDEHILHWTIEHHVTKIVHRGFPAHQFGVEFLQVGDCEHATRHLERLEEEVSRHHLKFSRDVVGVTPVTRIGRMDAEKLLGLAVSGIDARMNGYMRFRGVNV